MVKRSVALSSGKAVQVPRKKVDMKDGRNWFDMSKQGIF